MEFFDRMNVKLILTFDVLNVFFDFGKIGGKGGPSLRGVDGPEVDATGLYADGCDEWTLWMPLEYVNMF